MNTELKRPKALTTGITGQDGSHLAELLLDKGHEVRGLIGRSGSFSTGPIDRGALSSAGLAAVILVVGFGDGLAAGIQRNLGLPSPWVILLPLAGLILLGLIVWNRRSLPGGSEALVVVWLMTVWLLLQSIAYGRINVAGFLQLGGFVALVSVVKAVFAKGDAQLRAMLGPALLIAHLFLCLYLVVTWIAWQLTRVDLSVVALLYGRGITPYYGFRPAGWSVEPAWAAFSVAISFIGVYLLVPRSRTLAFVAMALAAAALQSATLFFFMAAVAVSVLITRRAFLLLIPIAFFVLVAVAVPDNPVTPRLEAIIIGNDPSAQMRVASAGVAWDVMARSFPFGVGYGNFRDIAVYGEQFSRLVDVETYQFYKSDLVVLTLAAELGIAGLALLAFVYRVLGLGSYLLPTLVLAMQAVLSGTILMPALLVLAAVIGTLRAPALGVALAHVPRSAPTFVLRGQ